MAKPSAALTTTPADWFDVLLLSDYTIFAAALLIVLITVYYRRGPPLPGTLQSTGKMQLCDKEGARPRPCVKRVPRSEGGRSKVRSQSLVPPAPHGGCATSRTSSSTASCG
jgi:hypothetical protein